MAFNACEWGQVRRAQASTIGGQIVMLRPAVVSQAIIVRPDSPITHVQALQLGYCGEFSCRVALPDAAVTRRIYGA